MSFAAGVFSLFTPGNPVVTNTTISSSTMNSTLSDIATGLSTCVLKDGSQTLIANIPMSGFIFTGLGAGTTSGHSVRYEQVLLLAGGTMTGNLLFTDATYDIGASGATRPRDLFLSRNAVIGGTTTLTGNVVSNLIFTDATYDIGASGATRPRSIFLSSNATLGGAISAATAAGAVVATQANMETGTATDLLVSPGRQAFHPGHPKAWGYITMSAGTPTLTTNYNVSSIGDTNVGVVTVTIATDFSTANYAINTAIGVAGSNADAYYITQAAGSFVLNIGAVGALTDDYASVSFSCFGDQA